MTGRRTGVGERDATAATAGIAPKHELVQLRPRFLALRNSFYKLSVAGFAHPFANFHAPMLLRRIADAVSITKVKEGREVVVRCSGVRIGEEVDEHR